MKKKQTKLHSFIESLSNELLGYLINTSVQILIFPLIGFNLSLYTNLFIGGIHSLFGVTRIYILRRFFDYKFKKHTKKVSVYECITNIIVGTIISFTIQPFVFLMVGITITTTSNMLVTVLFLVMTLIRLYVLRRFFHKKMKKLHKQQKVILKNES